MQKNIRNFAIIAHIDAGKSTLADRLLELTGTIPERQMREQFLDKMELEREKGITIKLQPIRMIYKLNQNDETRNQNQAQNQKSEKFDIRHSDFDISDSTYELNLIDTPGHVDFSYEVSRSLAAVEGAILIIDAKKGIQAQTIAHLEEAKKQNLVIIPAINKIDLAEIELERVIKEVSNYLQIKENEILLISAKTGEGVDNLLERIVKNIPSPQGDLNSAARALIFDSYYDQYKGVIAYVRMVDGEIKNREKLFFKQAEVESEVLDLGSITADFISQRELTCGEIGYIITNLKEISKARVGDTITTSSDSTRVRPLQGYEEPKHFVYADFYTEEGDNYHRLREALEELSLNDASFVHEPIRGQTVMGRGFRLGFLGMLHLEIVKERLIREHNVEVFITPPTVNLRIEKGGELTDLKDLFDYDNQGKIEEPYVLLELISPARYMGMIM
ncbi:MAG: GTP-binding protein LepA, partial [Candidatus Berkelbacteria bacterium Licking1014_96]